MGTTINSSKIYTPKQHNNIQHNHIHTRQPILLQQLPTPTPQQPQRKLPRKLQPSRPWKQKSRRIQQRFRIQTRKILIQKIEKIQNKNKNKTIEATYYHRQKIQKEYRITIDINKTKTQNIKTIIGNTPTVYQNIL